MLAAQLARIASVFFISISISSFASEPELALAKTREGVLDPGKPQSYELVLNAGDYAEIKVDPRGKELTLIAYDRSGSKFRGTKLGPEEDKFDLVVDGPGKYRLEVTATDHTIDVRGYPAGFRSSTLGLTLIPNGQCVEIRAPRTQTVNATFLKHSSPWCQILRCDSRSP